MPVGDRRSWQRVSGAGFALPRDAGRRAPPGELPSAPGSASAALVSRSRAMPVGGPHRENCPALLAARQRRGFRAPARCRSEGPTGRTAQRSWQRARGAGFALPRDAGRRAPPGELPSAPGSASTALVSRSRAMPVRDRRSWQRASGAGCALPRDAGRRAPPGELPSAPGSASAAMVSRSRAMPVGGHALLAARQRRGSDPVGFRPCRRALSGHMGCAHPSEVSSSSTHRWGESLLVSSLSSGRWGSS